MPRYMVERTFPDGLRIPINDDGLKVVDHVVSANAATGSPGCTRTCRPIGPRRSASTTRRAPRPSGRSPGRTACRSTPSPKCGSSTLLLQLTTTGPAVTLPGEGEAPGGTIGPVVVLEREALLGGLDSLLGEAVWHGGRLVLVRGEAGIGKSTLVKAFTSGREGRVLWGACDPVTPPRPLGPILDMADQGPPGLRQAIDAGDRHQVSSAFLGLLRAEGGPRSR